jgi:hypothetical protein
VNEKSPSRSMEICPHARRLQRSSVEIQKAGKIVRLHSLPSHLGPWFFRVIRLFTTLPKVCGRSLESPLSFLPFCISMKYETSDAFHLRAVFIAEINGQTHAPTLPPQICASSTPSCSSPASRWKKEFGLDLFGNSVASVTLHVVSDDSHPTGRLINLCLVTLRPGGF